MVTFGVSQRRASFLWLGSCDQTTGQKCCPPVSIPRSQDSTLRGFEYEGQFRCSGRSLKSDLLAPEILWHLIPTNQHISSLFELRLKSLFIADFGYGKKSNLRD
jgi:hypothetical protein